MHSVASLGIKIKNPPLPVAGRLLGFMGMFKHQNGGDANAR